MPGQTREHNFSKVAAKHLYLKHVGPHAAGVLMALACDVPTLQIKCFERRRFKMYVVACVWGSCRDTSRKVLREIRQEKLENLESGNARNRRESLEINFGENIVEQAINYIFS